MQSLPGCWAENTTRALVLHQQKAGSHCSSIVLPHRSGLLVARRGQPLDQHRPSACTPLFCKYAANPQQKQQGSRLSAIGFDLSGGDPVKGADRQAADLSNAAASLLLFSPVLKGKAAQAFLKVLLHLRKGSTADLLQAYGAFYTALVASKHASFQDYLLDQVLSVRDNPWVKGVAAGEIPVDSPLMGAVAHDLDVLQKLSVAESTIVSWVAEIAPGLPQSWLSSAARLGGSNASSGGPAKGRAATLELPQPLEVPCYIAAPLDAGGRAAWRAHIGGRWRWSEAAQDLWYHYAKHGHGLVGQHSTLWWRDGAWHAMEGAMHVPEDALPQSAQQDWQEELVESQKADTQGDSAKSLHEKDSKSGIMSRWHHTCRTGVTLGVRLVYLKATDMVELVLCNLASAMRQQPRVRYIVLADLPDLGPREWIQESDKGKIQHLIDVASSGDGPICWPSNAALCIYKTARKDSVE